MFDRRIAVLLILAWLTPGARASDIDPGATVSSGIDPSAINASGFAEPSPDDQLHPEMVKAQILLDRINISPGEINGQRSGNFDAALRAFAQAHAIPADAPWTVELWMKLTSIATGPVLTEYTVTREDAKGPFLLLPAKMEDMKGLRALGYSSLREALAEKFHMSESLLTRLNPDASFARAGERITVANVMTEQKPAPVGRVDIDKDRQTIKAYSSNGDLVAFFPASVGSEEKPSPSGTLKVTLIESDPAYHYNPKYHFKEVDTQRPFDLNPGPNNPLGSTWIALSQPSYGIHGTPEPALVGKSQSHGCVRVTNWDAQRLAVMVAKGTPVNFIEKQRDDPDFRFAAY